MRISLGIFLLLSWSLPSSGIAANDDPVLTQAVVRDVGRAQGFYLGQSFSLDRIERDFPGLAPQVQQVKLQFDASFGSSLTNMDRVMSRNFRDWPGVQKASAAATPKGITNGVPKTLEQARAFIEAVAKRARGEIHSPVLETLLTFHPAYISKPESELEDGFKARFAFKGQGETKGIQFHLDYPRSWSTNAAEQRYAVRNLASQNGRGPVMLIVLVKPLPFPPGKKPTEKELEGMVREIATPKQLQEMLPEDSVFIDGGPLQFAGRPGFFQKYSVKVRQADRVALLLTAAYTAYFQNSMIQLSCQVGVQGEDQQALRAHFARFEPMFKLVVDSFELEQQDR